MFSSEAALNQWAAEAERLWLFLDYDGTLAEFAPTPDIVTPVPEVIDLLYRLADNPQLRVVVISGRRLSDIQKLAPVPGVFLIGTYGLELQTAAGDKILRGEYELFRPYLEWLKPHWARLIAGHEGLFLEDKGWALALHARFAKEAEADQALAAARQVLEDIPLPGYFRLLEGHRFLEVAPLQAHKGKAVTYLLESFSWPEACLLYIGDDDKDAEAYDLIHARGGIVIWVANAASPLIPGVADFILPSSRAVRRWLKGLSGAVVDQ